MYLSTMPVNGCGLRGINTISRWTAVKSSEGMYEDPAFRIQWKAAQGRPRVAWHFFRQNVNAIAQAQKFLSIIQDDWQENDLAAIDWETKDGADRLDCLRNGGSFLYETEKALGKPSVLYTYPSYWNEIGGAGATSFKRYPLWLAQWPLDNWIANTSIQLPPYTFDKKKLADFKAQIESGLIKPMSLLPWGNDVVMWQFTARAWTKDIPGHPAIKKVADMNVIYKPWYAQEVPTAPQPQNPPVTPSYVEYVVDRPAINVRSGPSTLYSFVRYANQGEILQIAPIRQNGYAKMTDGNWVYFSFLKLYQKV
jgi:hypothetical protein